MPTIFVIEDQSHCEHIGQFDSLSAAWTELRRLSAIPRDTPPNVCPCTSWRTCSRDYEIIEYQTACAPWHEVRRLAGLEVSATGVVWGADAIDHGA